MSRHGQQGKKDKKTKTGQKRTGNESTVSTPLWSEIGEKGDETIDIFFCG